jgi:leucyl aminopeptidase
MRITVTAASPSRQPGDCLAVAVWQDDLRAKGFASPDLSALDREAHGALSAAITRRQFKGKAGDQVEAVGRGGKIVFFLGAGKRGEAKPRSWLALGARAAAAAQGRRAKSVVFAPRNAADDETVRLLVEGAHLGSYQFEECRGKGTKPEARPAPLQSLTLCLAGAKPEALRAAIHTGDVVGQATKFARDLVNTPSNMLTPTRLAERAKAWCENAGVAIEVLDKKTLEEMGCGALLAVNRGSAEPPVMIVMRHRPKAPATRQSLALVGKGVTFDTGGISIKPAKDMHEMKTDMAGAAAVIAAMGAIGRLDLPIAVTGVVPSTENMPDATAVKPGDVVTALNGKTIEILNTDAEGRLILADALAHVCKEKPTCLVDYATLTGSCVIALGPRIAGVMGNSDEFRRRLCELAEAAGERVWPLPLDDDFREELKSEVADVANIGPGRHAGAEIGAKFLEEFVDCAQWCHVDIAGPARVGKPGAPFMTAGASGCMVQTSVRLAEEMAKEKRPG